LNSPNSLFDHFPNEPAEYERAEAFWKAHWRELVRGSHDENEWEEPWIKNVFVDGTPCRDGNPIFSAVSRKRRLGVRVIQQQPNPSHDEEFSFWTDTVSIDSIEVKELVLSFGVTLSAVYDCLDAIRQWIDTEEVHLTLTNKYSISTGEFLTAKARHSFPLLYSRSVPREVDLAA